MVVRDVVPGFRQPEVQAEDEGLTLYSIGEPSDEEQQTVEYINRARADANAEAFRLATTTDGEVLNAYSYFVVDLVQMTNQFAALPQVRPPLSINTQLTQMARLHALDMFTNTFQGHVSSPNPPAPFTNGMTIGQRATAVGYPWRTVAENVFASSKSVFYGHAGFDVDWGTGAFGMQTPPGHRYTIHDRNTNGYTEIGVGIVLGTNSGIDWTTGSNKVVGPQIVCQDFGDQPGTQIFITGAARFDLVTNGFYDLGEGLGGICVTVEGTNGTPDPVHYAVTAQSGGYSVPVTQNGTYVVTFSGTNLADTTAVVQVSGSNSVKLDYVPAYQPPVITPPAAVFVNHDNFIPFTRVGAATDYRTRVSRMQDGPVLEFVNDGAVNWSFNAAAQTYASVQSSVSVSGSAFHLANPGFNSTIITLGRPFRILTNTVLSFQSRLGYATSDQTALAQISTDNGETWQDIYSRAGDGTSGDGSFAPINLPLGAYAGAEARARLGFQFTSGSAYTQTISIVGWIVDNFSVSNVFEVLSVTETNVKYPGTFAFNPTSAGPYFLEVQAVNQARELPYGPGVTVQAQAGTPPPGRLATLSAALQTNAVWAILLQGENVAYPPSGVFAQRASRLASNVWTAVTNATVAPLGNNRFEVLVPVAGWNPEFVRVGAGY